MIPHYRIKKDSQIYTKYLGELIFTLVNILGSKGGGIYASKGFLNMDDYHSCKYYSVEFSAQSHHKYFERIHEPQPKEYTSDDMLSFGDFILNYPYGIEATDKAVLKEWTYQNLNKQTNEI